METSFTNVWFYIINLHRYLYNRRVIISLYFQANNDKRLEEIREVPSLALEATIPNSRVMGGGTSVEAFFRTNSQFDLVRTVGKKKCPSVQ